MDSLNNQPKRRDLARMLFVGVPGLRDAQLSGSLMRDEPDAHGVYVGRWTDDGRQDFDTSPEEHSAQS